MPLFQGFATHAAGAELLPYKYDPGDIKLNEVEIAISHCGICRNDIHMVDNDWGISQYPLIPGHEIVGKVTAMGNTVLGLNTGDRVGVGWQANSCGHCEWCLQGEENLCPDIQGTCVHPAMALQLRRARAVAWHLRPMKSFLVQFRAAPNLLTLLRLFALPFLVNAVLDGHWNFAFALMMFAGVSDAFDGLLARLLHQHTTLGLYLDPIADKLLLSTLFIVLTLVHDIPRYVTILVFSRDLGILLIAILLFATGTLRDFRPSLLGKTNTFLQIIAVGSLMGSHVFDIPWLPGALQYLLKVIAVLAPISAAEYAWIVARRIAQPPPPQVAP